MYCITHQIPPFHFVIVEGRHIHHLVFGILILLAVGYAWLAEIGVGTGPSSLLASRLLSILYGVGAALTLDEFALLAESARCLLGTRGARQHRCRRFIRGLARGRSMGRSPLFSKDAQEVA